MKVRKLIKYTILLILILSMVTACSKKVKEVKTDIAIPKYSEVTVLKKSGSNNDAYNAKPDGLYKIGSSIGDVTDMTYSLLGKSIAQSVYLSTGQNLNKNLINIYKDDKMMVLDDFYFASDLMMNSSGDKLAYRCYASDSLESAQGLKIFDLNSREEINLNSKVSVSGNVYSWLDENSILYYGNIQGVENSDKIYINNLKDKKEEIYCDDLKGYCLYLLPVKEDIIYLKTNGDSNEIDYFNYKTKNKTAITTSISNIYSAKYNRKTNEVFFTGKANNDEFAALYKISLESFKVTRLTFDFPKTIDSESHIAVDSSGNIFFTGVDSVFMYDSSNQSLDLISSRTGEYRLYDNLNN